MVVRFLFFYNLPVSYYATSIERRKGEGKSDLTLFQSNLNPVNFVKLCEKANFPGMNDTKKVQLCVIANDITMFLHTAHFKKINFKISFRNGTLVVFEVKQKVFVTCLGHFAGPFNV